MMDAEFWHSRWEENNISFHEKDFNNLLVAHFNKLNLANGSRVFVPLCGKTKDMHWLLDQGYKIAGAELSTLAVEQFFEELQLKPKLTQYGKITKYSVEDIDIFAGDIFEINQKLLGPVHGVYDRAALVALPEQMRKNYAEHLLKITQNAPQLLIVFEYDQSLLAGPPFAIMPNEIERCYGTAMQRSEQARQPGIRKLKGEVEAEEVAWILR